MRRCAQLGQRLVHLACLRSVDAPGRHRIYLPPLSALVPHPRGVSRVSTVPTVRTVPPSSRSSLFHLDRPAQAMGFFDSIPYMLTSCLDSGSKGTVLF